MDFSFSSTPLIDHSFQPRTYSLRRILFGLVAVQCIAFFLYLFAGRTLLPSAMFDTMTAPFYAHFHPPQAENTDGSLPRFAGFPCLSGWCFDISSMGL